MASVSRDLEWRRAQWAQLREYLLAEYPNHRSELDYNSPWELLVAVILSAQCTDDRVNRVTPKLFVQFPTMESMASADIRDIEQLIYSTGFYHSKAKYIQGSAAKSHSDFAGCVPATMPELLTLPGVARKTANVVLQNAFGILDGIAVDTHILRFAKRFGLSDSENPEIVERDLMQVIVQDEWMRAPYAIKQYCRAGGKADGSGYRADQDPLVKYRVDL
jgi:endonuclease-3